jgi:hypothetical protein
MADSSVACALPTACPLVASIVNAEWCSVWTPLVAIGDLKLMETDGSFAGALPALLTTVAGGAAVI